MVVLLVGFSSIDKFKFSFSDNFKLFKIEINLVYLFFLKDQEYN